jgi:hypothetical protein
VRSILIRVLGFIFPLLLLVLAVHLIERVLWRLFRSPLYRVEFPVIDSWLPASSIPVLQEDPSEHQGNSADRGQMVYSPEPVAHSRPPTSAQLRHEKCERRHDRRGLAAVDGACQPDDDAKVLSHEERADLPRIFLRDGISPAVFPGLIVGFGITMPER